MVPPLVPTFRFDLEAGGSEISVYCDRPGVRSDSEVEGARRYTDLGSTNECL